MVVGSPSFYAYILLLFVVIMAIFLLPDDVLISLFTVWVDCHDVCNLDSANCSHADRNSFLDLLARETILLRGLSFSLRNTQNQHNYWNWLEVRNVRLTGITIDNKTFSQEMSVILNTVLSRVKSLVVTQCDLIEPKKFSGLYSTANMLDTLGFKDVGQHHTDNFYELFIPVQKFNKLLSLKLHEANVTDRFLLTVAQSCNSLTEISFVECKSITDTGIIALIASNRNLEKIKLNKCPLITALLAQYILNSGLDLISFSSKADNVVSMWEFILNFPKLQVLSLYVKARQLFSNNCADRIFKLGTELCLTELLVHGISLDLALHFVVVLNKSKNLTSLRMIDSTFCEAFADSIIQNCTGIKQLNLVDCDATGNCADYFAKMRIQQYNCNSNISNLIVVFVKCSFVNETFLFKLVEVIEKVDSYTMFGNNDNVLLDGRKLSFSKIQAMPGDNFLSGILWMRCMPLSRFPKDAGRSRFVRDSECHPEKAGLVLFVRDIIA